MAKGASGGKRGSGSGSLIAKSAMTAGGLVVDLSSNPLVYGANDTTMSAQVRATIDTFEAKRRDAKVEYNCLVDANGNVLESNRGSKGSVKSSLWARQNSVVLSHTHPRESGSGKLGGTFSEADLRNWEKYGPFVYRAAAAEGTYTIAKGSNFDGQSFMTYYKREDARLTSDFYAARKVAFAEYDRAVADYRANKVPYSTVQQAWDKGMAADAKNFNTMMVRLHNSLLAGQKQYGYSYSLERST